jgi:imidazolonepropionase-like amidohydrolase
MISTRTNDHRPLLLQGVRVVDGRGLRDERADLLVNGDRIEAIEPNLAVDGAAVWPLVGRTVTPGLMNAHAHVCLDPGPDPERILRDEVAAETAIRAAGRLRQTVAAGVTTIRDVGGAAGVDIALAGLLGRGEIPGPRMLAAGRVITMTGGHGYWFGVEADGADAVRHAVRSQIKAGATTIKVMATGGMMTPGQAAGAPQLTVDEMAAAVDEAHKADRIVAAHAESAVGARNAVLAGVDSIEHGHGIDEDVIALMLERGTALVPTILSDRAIVEAGPGAGIPDFVVDKCRALAPSLERTLRLAIERGVPIAAGNDGGAPLVAIGDIVGELELYVAHGMTPRAALATATTATADLFRMRDLGLLEVGYAADLLIVDGDPLVDIGALRQPRAVIARGMPVRDDDLESPPV